MAQIIFRPCLQKVTEFKFLSQTILEWCMNEFKEIRKPLVQIWHRSSLDHAGKINMDLVSIDEMIFI